MRRIPPDDVGRELIGAKVAATVSKIAMDMLFYARARYFEKDCTNRQRACQAWDSHNECGTDGWI